MARIFKENKLKELVSKVSSSALMDKIEIVRRWHDDYHNGSLKADKETSREQAFNQDFFVKVLGYAEKPDKIYSLEPKATSDKGQLPDAIIGYFDPEKEIKNVTAVIELKGANISLDKPQQREGNMSPIQQAFKYKTQYRICPFVLVSNFYEFRLFQDTQLDYEIWTLDELVSPKDDYFQFKKFYYLLNKENFTSEGGQTNTERLLSDIRIEQEEISKKFYSMYKDLRTELLRDIYAKNENIRSNIELGIEKAQKIIDRIVFICFCEDRGLLPDNTLPRTLAISQSSFGSLWNVLQGLFDAIDKGSGKLEIPDGYNGGLFREDTELNNLKISDEVLKRLASFGEYNFAEDLSVNILGHIFEQSISDLEEIKYKVQEANGIPTEIIGKRKKDGIFYTPDFVVNYIIENSLGTLLREKEQELKNKYNLNDDIQDKNYEKRSVQTYYEYQTYLQNIKVLDPACGSGAFLVKIFDYLLKENERVGQILGGNILAHGNLLKSILQNNIFGVDLNSESVEITKLSLWLKTAQKGKKLTTLDNNIKCGNSLIDDVAIAGDKAFNWGREFKDVMAQGGFDIVVGNPPYTYRNAISENEKTYFKEEYHSVEGNFDLYKLFIEKTSTLTRKNGYCSFIVPNTFLSAKTYKKLRELILENFRVNELFDLGLDVFENVVVESVIFNFSKISKFSNNKVRVKIQRDRARAFDQLQDEYTVDLSTFADEDKTFNINISKKVSPIIEKLRHSTLPLGKICYCTVGINTGYIKDELTADHRIDDRYHKMLSGKDIGRNTVDWPGEWIMYDPTFVKSMGEKGRSLPPENIFTEEKILVQRTRRGMKRKLVCYYDTEKYYNLNRLSNVVLTNDGYDLRFIYALLNSTLMDFYFNKFFNEYEVKPLHLSRLPIKITPIENQVSFKKIIEELLILNGDKQGRIKVFLGRVKSNFDQVVINKKIESFYRHDFQLVVAELKKQKISIPLAEQDEWEKYFNTYKTEINELQDQITRKDAMLDRMIYDLYGLNDDEIKTVERAAL